MIKTFGQIKPGQFFIYNNNLYTKLLEESLYGNSIMNNPGYPHKFLDSCIVETVTKKRLNKYMHIKYNINQKGKGNVRRN